jgi:thioredoxin 2
MRTFIHSTVYHARIALEERNFRVNPMEADKRGLLITCPKCGQRNRLKYEALKRPFRCGKCQTELRAPGDPVDVRHDLVFDALISRSALPVLVDFWAPWCGPCKMVAPEVRKVANETAGQLLVAKVNTEEVPSLSRHYRINAIPTMVLFRNGLEVARQAGAMAAPAIRKFIERGQLNSKVEET